MPEPKPRIVEIGASLLAIVAVLSAGRVLWAVAVNIGQDDWAAGARAVFLLLNAVALLFSIFIMVLADQVRRGRMWAWITAFPILTLTLLAGGLLTLITALTGRIPLAGTAIVLSALAALLTLAVPRATRDYFTAPQWG